MTVSRPSQADVKELRARAANGLLPGSADGAQVVALCTDWLSKEAALRALGLYECYGLESAADAEKEGPG